MNDLTERLRRWAISTDAVPASDLMDEAATEIEVQRACTSAARDEIARLRSQPCPYVTGDTTRYCTLTPLTLTDAEREAVELAIDSMNGVEDISASWSQRETAAIATLRGLLERLK
jgi:hypothetical protein